MTEYRRSRASENGKMFSGNLLSPVDALKKRESWKYVALEASLNDRPHEFEFKLGRWVFDLALFDTNVLVEFDGDYHQGLQLNVDAEKDDDAKEHGFCVVRRQTEICCVLDPAVLDGL